MCAKGSFPVPPTTEDDDYLSPFPEFSWTKVTLKTEIRQHQLDSCRTPLHSISVEVNKPPLLFLRGENCSFINEYDNMDNILPVMNNAAVSIHM